MKISILPLLLVITLYFNSPAQWQQEWSSNSISSYYYSGWIAFSEVGGEWSYKYYTIDETTFKIMGDYYSSTPQFQYSFTSAEILAGYQVFSLGVDLTGDNNVEFYVLSYYGSAEPYRQSFKIFDITTGQILFEKNDPSYFYTYPVIWDVDNDGILECSYAVYDYPNFVNYNYEVFNTNMSTSVSRGEASPLGFELKQNYPNPFNPTTLIEFELEKQSHISIDVFDILGRRVSTLINQKFLPGNHKVRFNGQNLSSGTYFYQLKAEGESKTRKMSIIK